MPPVDSTISFCDARAEMIEALARRSIEGGALAGAAALAPPEALAAGLAAGAEAGRAWWRTYPNQVAGK